MGSDVFEVEVGLGIRGLAGEGPRGRPPAPDAAESGGHWLRAEGLRELGAPQVRVHPHGVPREPQPGHADRREQGAGGCAASAAEDVPAADVGHAAGRRRPRAARRGGRRPVRAEHVRPGRWPRRSSPPRGLAERLLPGHRRRRRVLRRLGRASPRLGLPACPRGGRRGAGDALEQRLAVGARVREVVVGRRRANASGGQELAGGVRRLHGRGACAHPGGHPQALRTMRGPRLHDVEQGLRRYLGRCRGHAGERPEEAIDRPSGLVVDGGGRREPWHSEFLEAVAAVPSPGVDR
mmetsp:Transcript_103039/g.287024  ORF Transcript_103039/g.287024 Transcript_103039/m.287024 type:complete len:294 (+) Transcript_103039:113-994(+)